MTPGCPDPRSVKPRGRIFAVVGPSGSGKDTLLQAVRALCPDLHVVRRVITRPPADDAEPYEGVSPEEFQHRAAANDFALTWEAHGLRYGVPATASAALEAGRSVVFNGSRKVIAEAQARFPGLHVVLVTARPGIRAARLARRRREDAAQIRERMEREDYPLPEGIPVSVIENEGTVAEAAERLAALLCPPARECD